VRRDWLDLHALADAGAAAADRDARALGPGVRETLLAGADRLADVSPHLAARCYRQAPAAWVRFGRDGFARWLALGEELARPDAAGPQGALTFFDVPPARLGPGGLETAAAWCALAGDVSRASRHLAVAFLTGSVGVLGREDAGARLRAWAAAGLWLHEAHGWRGAFLAQAFFGRGATALGLLPPHLFRPWAEVGLALGGARRESAFFAALPAGLDGWAGEEQAGFLRLVGALAAAGPRPALAFHDALPPALAGLDPETRATVLGVLGTLAPALAPLLAEVAPLMGALVLAVPPARRGEALAHVGALARTAPEAAVAALRSLPRVHEEAAPAAVRRWFETGLAVAAENAHAGRAYFALESATGLRVLRSASTAALLAETSGVWRKFARMLCGEDLAVAGLPETSLRPPLETHPGEARIGLPERVDLLPTHEENARIYRLLAAAGAGRRAFGTYADEAVLAEVRASGLLEDLFLLADGVRIHHRLAAAYPGLAADARWAGRRLLARWAREEEPTSGMVLDALLAFVLAGGEVGEGPPWLAADGARAVARLVGPLARPGASARDSLGVARALLAVLALPPGAGAARPGAETGDALLDGLVEIVADAGDDAPLGAPATTGTGATATDGEPGGTERLGLELGPQADAPGSGGHAPSLDELRRLLAAGATITQSAGGGDDAPGLPVTDLAGKLPPAERDALRRLLEHARRGTRRRPGPGSEATEDGRVFCYDEWDDPIGDYRSRWCRLREVDLAGDGGEFFSRALGDYAQLIPRVRRQFERLRPEMYRTIRGLEDGEDFDLNAVVDARSEARARRPPSPKLYRTRLREARDVATLFLLDMSASTDEPLDRSGRRIIDVTKEALVVMAEALDALGDAYAVYGFSGEGRAQVEFYPVKAFAEPLGPAVRARIGGIGPRRSTRMGTALRHALTKLATVGARSRHLILLSDGFPQDIDYGDDRRSHAYGIRDTAMALREVEAARVTPFCITVDPAGHDYLRAMCDGARYVVIEDVAALPRELPKIYQRVVRPGSGPAGTGHAVR
jgi:hypothetical protein